MNIEDKDIELLLADLDHEELLFKLASSFDFHQDQMMIQHHKKNNLPPPPLAARGYSIEYAKRIWQGYRSKLKKHLCDEKNHQPKEKLMDLIEGNRRDIAVSLITLVVSTLETTIAIATPVAALCLKEGLTNLCKNDGK